jgi:hypothetical protein
MRGAHSSAHRSLDERADPFLDVGGQPLQGNGGRPHVTFVEVAAVSKPNVAYLALNLCALWKKQTTDIGRRSALRVFAIPLGDPETDPALALVSGLRG